MNHPKQWMKVNPQGLYCTPADSYIDPTGPATRAIITHGHADHARGGHDTVYATPETMAIMRCRYGEQHAKHQIELSYGEVAELPGGVSLSFAPAGHILGSAQALLEYKHGRIVISGDFKRRADPTCVPFKPVACDVFVTEATFGLPVFQHPPIEQEVQKILDSLLVFPERCHIVGVYALGKCQRLMMELRALGYNKTIFLHGALVKLCELYEKHGVTLGAWQKVSEVADKKLLAGQIVLAPPSALADRWSRNLPDALSCMASGWMQIRARAKQRRVELPMIISDHADWSELLQTIQDVGAPEIWVTHGRDEALVYQAEKMGYKAQALALIGYEDEDMD